MEPFTIHLEHPQNNKWFWIFQVFLAGSLVIQGMRGLDHPDSTKQMMALIQIISTGILFTIMTCMLFLARNPDRYPRIVFTEQGLLYRPNYLRKAHEFSWSQITSIQIKTSKIELTSSSSSQPLSIAMPGYVLGQQIKQLFQTAAKEHNIAIQP